MDGRVVPLDELPVVPDFFRFLNRHKASFRRSHRARYPAHSRSLIFACAGKAVNSMYAGYPERREPIWMRRLSLRVRVVLIGRIRIGLLVLVLGSAFGAVGFIQPLHRHFFLRDHAAVLVLPDS